MNAAEDRLSELMDAATRALAPPIDTILAEGARLGRRRRRRRHAAVVTATAAVVLLVGAGAAAGVHLTREAHGDDAAAPVVHRVSRAPTPSRIAPTPVPTADNGIVQGLATPTATATMPVVPINADFAAGLLKAKLGPGWTFSAYKPSVSGMSLLDVDVNDGKGLAQVFVAIASTKKSGMDPLDCAQQAALLKGGGPRPPGAPPPSCDVQKEYNGDLVMQEVLKADAYGEYQYRIIANRSDGVALEITAANGDWSKAATEVTRATPPLSVAEWTAIALDPNWQLQEPVNLTLG